MPRVISKTVKGVPRREWLRQIGSLPKKRTPAGKIKNAENAKKARQVQMERDGCLFGGNASYQKFAPKPVKLAPVADKPKFDLSLYRQSVDDFQ